MTATDVLPRGLIELLVATAVAGFAVSAEAQGEATVSILGPRGRPLSPDQTALGITHRVPNDAALPREFRFEGFIPDPDGFRVEVTDSGARGRERLDATLSAIDRRGGIRSRLTLTLRESAAADGRFRSPWLRLVGDDLDIQAPGVRNRLLLVALRDRVEARYDAGTGDAVTATLDVGRPNAPDDPRGTLRGRLRVRILRVEPGGRPSIGNTDREAEALAREQVRIANEVWLQCAIDFGAPSTSDVAVIDPPGPSLLSFGDEDGLPAAGGGRIVFRAGGIRIGPVPTRARAEPVQTALDVADAARRARLLPLVTVNAPTEFGAGPSADLQLRTRGGVLVELEPDGTQPLSTDRQQSVLIGSVDLRDGLHEFDNMTALAGTLEERTLVKALADDDPTTVDIFLVNRFSGGTRQGEAFIESDAGSIVNTLILDRNGIRQQRAAWTVAHELGHILLDQPYHPDNTGPDRPWLLMDADSSLGLVTGPKRVTWDECHRVRDRSGPAAVPRLLEPYSD